MSFRRRQTVLIDNSVQPGWMAGNYVRVTILAGGAAGNHAVPGIEPVGLPPVNGPGDVLTSVMFFNNAIGTLADLTSEFTITSTGTINNAAGTDTAAGLLVVVWEDRTQ